MNIIVNNFLKKQRGIFLNALFLFLVGCLSGIVFLNNIFIPILVLALNLLYICTLETKHNLSRVFFLGFSFGIGNFFVSLYWIAYAFETGNYGGFTLGIIAVLLLSLLLSLFTGSVCVITKLIGNYYNLNRVGSILVFTVFLSFGEYLRGSVFGGFPWNTIGYIWAFSHYTLQSISWFGIYGLGVFTYLACFSPLFVKTKLKYVFFLLTPLILIMLTGIFRLIVFDYHENTSISVKIVQPSISQKEKLKTNLQNTHLQKLINLSKNNIDNINTIFIWPESAIHIDLQAQGLNKKELFSWMQNGDILISGATRREYNHVDDTYKLSKIFNSIFVIGEEGKIHHYYDKKHLVPFGEFIPLRFLLNFTNLVGSHLDFSPGENDNVYALPKPFPKIALLVCYEIIFSGNVIQGYRPDVIVNITNDAWYGNTAGPIQHLSTARARAIEEGLPVLRSANTGISAVIDPYGRYTDLLSLSQEGVIKSYIPNKINPTYFSIYGNAPFFVLCILILFLGRIYRN